jgi:membrane-associated phospholipid phosphatase
MPTRSTAAIEGGDGVKTRGGTLAALTRSVRANWPLKLLLLVGLNGFVSGLYFYNQHHVARPVHEMGLTFLDRAVPFRACFVLLYESLYLMMPIAPFLMAGRKPLIKYGAGIAMLGAVANFFFHFFPTACPRPPYEGACAAYNMLVSVEKPLNACPSLHAAMAVYTALGFEIVFRELGLSRWWRLPVWGWSVAILYATMATKQHVVFDLAAGSVLGAAAWILMFVLIKEKRTER